MDTKPEARGKWNSNLIAPIHRRHTVHRVWDLMGEVICQGTIFRRICLWVSVCDVLHKSCVCVVVVVGGAHWSADSPQFLGSSSSFLIREKASATRVTTGGVRQ